MPKLLQLLARDLIQTKKAIGQVMSIFAVRMSSMNAANKYFHTTWRQTPAYQGGFVLDGGVHDVALLRMILGEVAQVSAHTAQFAEVGSNIAQVTLLPRTII
jgi:predicted dehydrogenase